MNKSIESLIDEAFNNLFDKINEINDDLYDLTIEYKDMSNGKTIRRSWKEREEILKSLNK